MGRPKGSVNGDGCSYAAARHARATGISMVEASRVFGVTAEAVSKAWRRLWPHQSPLISKRGPKIDEHW